MCVFLGIDNVYHLDSICANREFCIVCDIEECNLNDKTENNTSWINSTEVLSNGIDETVLYWCSMFILISSIFLALIIIIVIFIYIYFI